MKIYQLETLEDSLSGRFVPTSLYIPGVGIINRASGVDVKYVYSLNQSQDSMRNMESLVKGEINPRSIRVSGSWEVPEEKVKELVNLIRDYTELHSQLEQRENALFETDKKG